MNKTNILPCFIILSILVLFASCNNKKANNEEDIRFSEYDRARLDSIEAVHEMEREKIRLEENRKKGKFLATDTIYFGDLQITIDSVVVKKSNTGNDRSSRMLDLTMGGSFQSYDIYLSMKNSSNSQTLTIPYIFPELTKEEERMRSNDTGTTMLLGTRLFIETNRKKKKGFADSYEILPGKTLAGYYHVMSRGAKNILISYGDHDYEDEDDDTPKGYEDKEVRVDLSSMLPKSKKK